MRHVPKNRTKWSVVSGQWSVTEETTPMAGKVPLFLCPPLATDHRPLTTTRPRRGVLLLVVLSLLILFSLVAVTFVLVAGNYYSATRNAVRNEQVGDDPRQLLDEVLGQCIRGTLNPHSGLRGHSLLEDLYGNDGIAYSEVGFTPPVTPTITLANVAGNGQVFDLTFTPAVAPTPVPLPPPPPPPVPVPPSPPTNTINHSAFPGFPVYASVDVAYPMSLVLTAPRLQPPGFFNGCVFTAIGGAADRKSARVLGWSFSGGNYTVRLMAFDGVSYTDLDANKPTGFVINGRPFNGTGAGFDQTADPATEPTLINAGVEYFMPNEGLGGTTITIPYALLPNPVFWKGVTPTGGITVTHPLYTDFGGIGGFDEDYDAADPQNMLLAHVPLNATYGGAGTTIIPSLHRPRTITYVDDLLTPYNTDRIHVRRQLERQVELRPTFRDHPQFPRRTPTSDYDVDNDGDGVAESIWVDAGLPVRTAADGRTYKPMVAILCLDMDGRLNVNAQGSVAHLDANYDASITNMPSPDETLANFLYNSNATAAPVVMSRGQGYGPAEVSLLGLFSSATAAADYERLMFGGTLIDGRVFEGRYGEQGYTTGTYGGPLPGASSAGSGPDDVLVKLKRYGMPINFYPLPPAAGYVLTNYNSPSDLWGRGAMGLDYAGQPVYTFLQKAGTWPGQLASSPMWANIDPEMPHDPYSVNLLRDRAAQNVPTANDNLFTIGELERVLRLYDVDSAMLPDRLRSLLNPDGLNTNELSAMVTTDSIDLPVPAVLASRDLAVMFKNRSGTNAISSSQTILDLVRTKIAEKSGLSTTDAQVTNRLNLLISIGVIAPELIAGQRFDLNRPFGNGFDDDGDGIVDEPDEYNTAKEVPADWTTSFSSSPPTFMDLDRDGAGPVVTEGLRARQTYAKQLYFLMMLLADNGYLWAEDNGAALTAAEQEEVTSRQIAQWAINVVDFRDPDSIMTPFEYDAKPFDRWEVDGDISTTEPSPDRRVVWGVERPELLITETLAFHDRRVEDRDIGELRDPIPPAIPDEEFDQVRVPQGSAFFELYSPRTPKGGQEVYPNDLYLNGQLNLGKLAPANGAGVQHPVWRLAITGPPSNAANAVRNRIDLSANPNAHADVGNFNPTPDPPPPNGPPIYSSLFDPSSPEGALQIERLVWFANLDPTTHPDSSSYAIYWNASGTSTLLNPGGFAVVGPRDTTYVGLNNGGGPATQQFHLNPAGGTVQFDTTTGAGPTRTALPIICSMIPTGWAEHVGVSVSEPFPNGGSYYSNVGLGPGPILGVNDMYATPIDLPADGSAASPNPASPINGNWSTRTELDFRTALLQRLADPTQPYNQNTNPYITVDWQNIDLTVFNGQPPQTAEKDPDDIVGNAGPLVFGTRERGTTAKSREIWNPIYQSPSVTMLTKGAAAVFDFNLTQTIAQVNVTFGTPWTPPAELPEYNNCPTPSGQQTYPWLTWNNRPFVSEAELMLVPAAAAEQMLRNFTTLTGPPAAGQDPYALNPDSYHRPYRHLFNFRLSGIGTATTAPNYARILDYVHVPSLYVGTETYLNPGTAPGPVNGAPGFIAPFNAISNYREPGRININTISGRADSLDINPVWSGIVNAVAGDPTRWPSWREIVASRRGDANVGANITGSTNLSSYFARPFRTSAGAAYALPGSLPGGATPTPIPEVEATLLRQAPGASGRGLFENRTDPVIGTLDHANPFRHPYFHHQPIEKLRNLITTRSNVYAIWITVGYFEVRKPKDNAGADLPIGPDTPYPDGYQLMQEMGSDTGEIVRHRAFYIYDRSIPVGFEPGKDHNYADGLLLKRFIE